ncbi:hypothetical protein TYRP_012263 [Tyrophagus putrescentiae]|nr:hypothetical protein TYRP_012263 [Tyrophagus putrescentiae]
MLAECLHEAVREDAVHRRAEAKRADHRQDDHVVEPFRLALGKVGHVLRQVQLDGHLGGLSGVDWVISSSLNVLLQPHSVQLVGEAARDARHQNVGRRLGVAPAAADVGVTEAQTTLLNIGHSVASNQFTLVQLAQTGGQVVHESNLQLRQSIASIAATVNLIVTNIFLTFIFVVFLFSSLLT